MKVKLFMENMWEFFLVFYFVPYKVNIPMHAGEFFYVFYLFHTKLIFPCMQGDLNKSYIRNIQGGQMKSGQILGRNNSKTVMNIIFKFFTLVTEYIGCSHRPVEAQ